MSKFLHTMIRVGNLDRSVKFYTELLGMKELRRRDVPDGKYTLAFLGYGEGNAEGQGEIELTYNYGVEKYEQGNAFGHLAVGLSHRAGRRANRHCWSLRCGKRGDGRRLH